MGFRLETPGKTPQIYTNGHARRDDDPYKILYHRQNLATDKKQIVNVA